MAKLTWPILVFCTFLFPTSTSCQEPNAGLLQAAKTRDTARVLKLLEEGADANTKDKKGWTPLMWAALFGRAENAQALVAKGANVNAQDNIGWTALMSAATKGRAPMVHFLIEKGAIVNAKDNNGWTALMGAAGSGNLDSVSALLEKGADVNAKDKTGWTALMGAADADQVETVRALLRAGADRNAVDKDGNGALSAAKSHKYTELTALLEVPLAPPQNKKHEDSETVSSPTAVVSGSSVASHPATETSAKASPTSKPPVTAVPSERGPSLESQLLDAAQAGDTADVQNLLALGANINSRGIYGNTPLMSAALTGHTDTLKLLLQKGADVDARGNTGRTALMEAALEGYTDAVKALLEKGVDVSAKDDGGWTALFWASFSQRSEVVRALLEKGADVNAKNKYDDTALIRAAYGGDGETITVLLEYKPDINAQDDMGRTALIEAARQGHADAVQRLLEKGADAKVRDRDGETALSLAEKQKHADVAALLKNPLALPQLKNLEKATTPLADASSEANPPVTGVSASALVMDKKAQSQAYFRIGMNMQMVEVGWSQLSDLAVSWTESIQQDLVKLGAPSDLTELASQTHAHLKRSPQENSRLAADFIHNLRAHLDGFCNAHPEGKLFYAAGGFAYQLTVLGGDLSRPEEDKARIDESRRRILPLASAMTDQCLETAGCKDLALIYFSDAATILKKAQLTSTEGAALRKDAMEIEMALNNEEH